MILGLGCDVVQIPRIGELYRRKGKAFLNKIFSPEELVIMPSGAVIESYVAKRYAAKEAFSKAVGTGIGMKFSFRDIEIFKESLGKPFFSKKTLNMIECPVDAYLSLSDDWPIAIAQVILCKRSAL
jgi:holo-[acyl-carrier protein] synthase